VRDYGVVSPKFWIGGTGKALRGNMEAQIVAIYLMTSPHANMVGVFYCPLDTIAKETGIPIEGASKGLHSLIEAGFCQFDKDSEEVFVCRMAAYQVGEQLEPKDNRCKGIARELERVMSDRLKSGFRAMYSVAFHLPAPTLKTPAPASPLQAPPKPEAGTGSGTGSEDSAKAGGAAAKAKTPEELAKAELWRAAVSLFTGQGMPEPQARQFFGKLAKDYPDGNTVTDALRDCIAEQPADARAWLTAECQRRAGTRKQPRRATSHTGLADKDYHEGVTADGTLA
jgi:hypothetical protein